MRTAHLAPVLLLAVAAASAPWTAPLSASVAAADATATADSLGWEVSPEAQVSARAEVAARWTVDAGDVVLEWGPAGPGSAPGPAAEITLSGTGAGGYFVAEFSEPGHAGVTRRRVRAGHVAQRMVAARRLERGAVLAPEDLARSAELTWGPPLETSAAVEPGWVVRRLVEAGTPLAPPAVSPPLLVESGEVVEVRWSRGPVSIRLAGRAQGSGVAGETVYVRTNSGRRMKAVVQSRGVVILNGGGDR